MSLGLVLVRLLKYGFGLSVMGATAYVIKISVDLKYIQNDARITLDGNSVTWMNKNLTSLDSNYPQCLKIPIKEFCLMTTPWKLTFLNNRKRRKSNGNSPAIAMGPREFGKRHPVDAAITEFLQVAKALDVRLTLIEPSILFCMLTSEHKDLLQKRAFKLPMGIRNTVSFAMSSSNSSVLNTAAAQAVFRSHEFEHYSTKNILLPWLNKRTKNKYGGHHFFLRRLIVVHLVVFHERGDFFWHSGLSQQDIPPEILTVISSPKDLLFTNYHSSYEKFSSRELSTNDIRAPTISIPENPAFFLLQMMSSRFLECRSGLRMETEDSLDKQNLDKVFKLDVQVMKYILEPLFVEFRLFSDTLLGWYRDCDLSFNKEAKFAIAAEDIKDLNFVEKFENISYFLRTEIIGSPEQGNLEIMLGSRYSNNQLHILYRNNSFSNDSDEDHLLYKSTKHEWCSAELRRQRVLVLCDAREIPEDENDSETNVYNT